MASKLESELSKQLSVVDALVQDLENLKTMDDHTRDEISMRFNAARNDHKEISAMLHAISVDDKDHAGVDGDEGYTEEELRRLEEEELGLKGEKEELEKEEEKLQQELLVYLKDRARLEKNEDDFWNMANRIEIENIELEEESTFTRQQIMNFNSELDRLSKIYILNEVFDIKILKDYMPTISKLHMGMNPETGSVNWDETNAGFGHTMLLLNYLCIRNSIKIPNIEFEPLGNISAIKVYHKDSSQPKECKLAGPPQDEVNTFSSRKSST
jgi:Apg6 BARA domain